MRRAWIPLGVIREVTSQPCEVCGIPFDLRCDHIVSVANGGSNDLANLQSLCRTCNHIKHSTKTNDEVRAIVAGRGIDHFMRAAWIYETRYHNPYSRPSLEEWQHAMPEKAEFARLLHSRFAASLD